MRSHAFDDDEHAVRAREGALCRLASEAEGQREQALKTHRE